MKDVATLQFFRDLLLVIVLLVIVTVPGQQTVLDQRQKQNKERRSIGDDKIEKFPQRRSGVIVFVGQFAYTSGNSVPVVGELSLKAGDHDLQAEKADLVQSIHAYRLCLGKRWGFISMHWISKENLNSKTYLVYSGRLPSHARRLTGVCVQRIQYGTKNKRNVASSQFGHFLDAA